MKVVIVNSLQNKFSYFGCHTFKRRWVFKIFIIILSSLGLFFGISRIYSKWNLQPDIVTTLKLKPSRELPMPAMTFCSTHHHSELQWEEEGPVQYIIQRIRKIKKPEWLTPHDQNFLGVLVSTNIQHRSSARLVRKPLG